MIKSSGKMLYSVKQAPLKDGEFRTIHFELVVESVEKWNFAFSE